ncbi:MAG: hypothetical protein IJ428_02855 [Clostridia bacterium]|nr:hypothetical protein [Clostridia bacterium]
MYGQPYYYSPMTQGPQIPIQTPMMQQAPMDQLSQLRAQQQQPPNDSIKWVQGEEGAKAYLVAAGNTVLLMDSENTTFYLKSTDPSGMPMPLKIFDYTERTQSPKSVPATAQIPTVEYVTKEEFKRFAAELDRLNRELGITSTEGGENG